MNNNMTDILEQYIKELFNKSTEDYITIKRSNVAQKFDCVPSQLNYGIKTRFTPEHGFIIESKRGGGGFIRITKITLHKGTDYLDYLIDNLPTDIIEIDEAIRITKILLDKEYENDEEKRMEKAFRNLADDENDIELFESYVRGGIEILYEKCISDSTQKDDFMDNIINFLEELKIKYPKEYSL